MFFIECLLVFFQKEAPSSKTDKLDIDDVNHEIMSFIQSK